LLSLPFLIALAAADPHQRDQFGAPEGAGEAEGEQRAVAQAGQCP
jgi:hypothetical protein